MAYPYMSAGSFINDNTPKQDYTDLVQQTLNEQFYNASDVYTIQQETALASGVYENIDVRVNNVVNGGVGDNVEADFKKLIFRNLNQSVDLGRMYLFDNNYWITTNVDKIKTLGQTVIIKRCNNVLRWLDSSGALYEVPCSLGYVIEENRDYSTAGSALVVPSGMLRCTIQLNSYTNKIKPNQRFLIGNSGNWTSYRVEGGGINNFNNQLTTTNSTNGILKLTLTVDFMNYEADDIVNGIANENINVYALTLNQTSISGSISQTVQLEDVVTLNGETVSRSVVWTSNNELIATVSSSGLVTFVAEGNTTITCKLLGNDLVFDSCDVSVTSSPVDNYQVIATPSINYILQGEEVIWNVYLYKNGVQQADVFTFSLDPNTVPSTKYIYTVEGDNSFKIHNYGMFLTDTLQVTATSGIYSLVLNVLLKGAW